MHMYGWRSKNNCSVLLKWPSYNTESINKCVWLRTARLEVASNWKTSERFFQVCALLSQIKQAKTDFARFFPLKFF